MQWIKDKGLEGFSKIGRRKLYVYQRQNWRIFIGMWFGVYEDANMWIGALCDCEGLQVEFC